MNRARAASLVSAGFDALPMQTAVLDGGGTIVYTNSEWRSFGEENGLVGPADSLGTNYLDVCDASSGDDATTAAEGLRELLDGDRETFSFEYPCHTPSQRRWFTMRARRFEHEGKPHLLVSHADITDRKLAEMRTQEKVEQLETVAGLLSHDLRNPLAVALGHTEMLASESAAIGEHVDTVRSALERMEAILDDALVLVRHNQVSDTRAVDLEDVAERCWTHVKTEGATLSVEGHALFQADPDLLEHVFENLFRNSVEHSSTSSRTQSDDSVEHGGGDTAIRVGALDDGFYVEDDGPGVPPDERDSVFDVGHTVGRGGSGLGLSIVAQIVNAHGWVVSLTESESGGARFEFAGVDVEAQ